MKFRYVGYNAIRGDSMLQHYILIVENDMKVQGLFKEFLLAKDYAVEVASDGLEGMRKINNQNFDLIILDLALPHINGFEITKLIRRQSNVPIIMLSALKEVENQIKGFNIGIDDYITKPFSFYILLKRIEAILKRRYEKNATNYLIFKELCIDCESYTAYVNGKCISLTTKEFKILKLLMQNTKNVLMRSTILGKVWGCEYIGGERTIDTHIKNLRKKLDIPYIHTVKGVGYKFDE